jgi:hypothetical protein
MSLLASDPAAIPALSFFGDSSSRDREYMVAGGFAVAQKRIEEINAHIADLRQQAGIRSEFHWSAYRGGNRQKSYEALVQYAFDLIKNKHAELHLIVAKFGGHNHQEKFGGNRDTGVNRMYYQLCLHRVARLYGAERAIHVRLDAGNDCAEICGFRNQLCADAYRQYSSKPNCIRTIEPVCSTKSGIVQMADVIVGAVAAKCNRVAHKSKKGDLADFVQNAAGLPSWEQDTPRDARGITVWWHRTKERVPVDLARARA